MFEVGDKIVLIDWDGIYEYFYPNMKLNKIYTVQSIERGGYIKVNESAYICNGYRFMLLSEYRRKKLEKICSKLETK